MNHDMFCVNVTKSWWTWQDPTSVVIGSGYEKKAIDNFLQVSTKISMLKFIDCSRMVGGWVMKHLKTFVGVLWKLALCAYHLPSCGEWEVQIKLEFGLEDVQVITITNLSNFFV